jgi:hypothetical protein
LGTCSPQRGHGREESPFSVTQIRMPTTRKTTNAMAPTIGAMKSSTITAIAPMRGRQWLTVPVLYAGPPSPAGLNRATLRVGGPRDGGGRLA